MLLRSENLWQILSVRWGEMQTRHSDLPVHQSIVADSRCGRVGTGTEVVSTGGSYEINELRSSRPLRFRDLP